METESAIDLSVELWHNISSIYRRALRALNARLAEEKMTFPQYSILRSLGRHGPMPMNKLSEYMLVAPANVTGLVDRLEKKGYVKRTKVSRDRRLYQVELTEKGAQTYNHVSSRFREYIRDLFQSLTKEETELLTHMLLNIRNDAKAKASAAR